MKNPSRVIDNPGIRQAKNGSVRQLTLPCSVCQSGRSHKTSVTCCPFSLTSYDSHVVFFSIDKFSWHFERSLSYRIFMICFSFFEHDSFGLYTHLFAYHPPSLLPFLFLVYVFTSYGFFLIFQNVVESIVIHVQQKKSYVKYSDCIPSHLFLISFVHALAIQPSNTE